MDPFSWVSTSGLKAGCLRFRGVLNSHRDGREVASCEAVLISFFAPHLCSFLLSPISVLGRGDCVHVSNIPVIRGSSLQQALRLLCLAISHYNFFAVRKGKIQVIYSFIICPHLEMLVEELDFSTNITAVSRLNGLEGTKA